MKVACLLGPLFEDSEFKKPYEAFKQAGHEVTIKEQSKPLLKNQLQT